MLRIPAGPALVLTWVRALPPAASAQVTVGVHVSVPAVRVVGPPPPLRLETRPAAPSGQHVWVAGYSGSTGLESRLPGSAAPTRLRVDRAPVGPRGRSVGLLRGLLG